MIIKRLEWLMKVCLAMALAVVWWRPRRAVKAGAQRVLLVRIDNRVGEALLTTPLIDALAAAGHEVHVLTHPKMRRVLEGHPRVTKLHGYAPRSGVLKSLRNEQFDVVINCGNWDLESVTSALVARTCGGNPKSVVVGPANFPSGWLMDVGVKVLDGSRAEAVQRRHLGSPLVSVDGPARLSFRETSPFKVVEGPYAVVNPGGRLGFRRVAPERFAFGARTLLERGITPLVTWGPGEEALVDEVVKLAPGAVRAPATTIDQLASLMRGAKATLCNNTGPMHLAVAVGCPTVALFLHMEVARWGHAFAPHQMVDLTNASDADHLISSALESLDSFPLPPAGEGLG